MAYESSPERVDQLFNLSERVYDAINTQTDGETRARRMVRVGITVSAQLLENSYGFRYAGDTVHSLFIAGLNCGEHALSITDRVYDPYPNYRKAVDQLDAVAFDVSSDPELVRLADAYSDATRSTISRDGNLETDASHAIHLYALALPYAAQHYPDLDPAKLVLYCLIHDLPEAYVGDTPSIRLSDQENAEKIAKEQGGSNQFEREFASRYPKLVKLLEDYENLRDDEAEFVKSIDKIDPAFSHFSNGGSQLTGFHNIVDREMFYDLISVVTDRMMPYAGAYPKVLEDRAELTRRVADITWPEK